MQKPTGEKLALSLQSESDHIQAYEISFGLKLNQLQQTEGKSLTDNILVQIWSYPFFQVNETFYWFPHITYYPTRSFI